MNFKAIRFVDMPFGQKSDPKSGVVIESSSMRTLVSPGESGDCIRLLLNNAANVSSSSGQHPFRKGGSSLVYQLTTPLRKFDRAKIDVGSI